MSSTSSSNNRDRVIQFEAELQQNITLASKVETEINKLAYMRKTFIESMTVSGTGAILTRENIKISRLEANIISLDMILRECEVKEVKSNQELPLIELSSTPLATNETYEQRNKKISDLNAANQDIICDTLMLALGDIRSARSKLESIQYDVLNVEESLANSNAESIRTVEISVTHFIDKLKDYINQANAIRKRVTGDYLILRHNARVAEKILCERRQSAVVAREDMQRNLDMMVKDAANRRTEVEEALTREQQMLLHDARQSVMTKESEVRALKVKVETQSRSTKARRVEIKNEIRKYEQMYRQLEKRREKEVKTICVELKKFRDMITAVEDKLSIKV